VVTTAPFECAGVCIVGTCALCCLDDTIVAPSQLPATITIGKLDYCFKEELKKGNRQNSQQQLTFQTIIGITHTKGQKSSCLVGGLKRATMKAISTMFYIVRII